MFLKSGRNSFESFGEPQANPKSIRKIPPNFTEPVRKNWLDFRNLDFERCKSNWIPVKISKIRNFHIWLGQNFWRGLEILGRVKVKVGRYRPSSLTLTLEFSKANTETSKKTFFHYPFWGFKDFPLGKS